MPRIKVKHESNFTVVQNDFIYDKALDSFDRGVLLFMLTKKDDYCFSVERISKEIDETKQKVSKSLKKMTEAGYLERRQATRNNRFAEMTYYVADIPCLKKESDSGKKTKKSRSPKTRTTENQSTEIRPSANRPTQDRPSQTQPSISNTNISSTNKSNTKKSSINKKPQKQKFAEAVELTEKEYQTLCDKHSKAFTDKCVEVLNNYKLANGKTYKSDYYAILNWVEERVQRENPQLDTVQKETAEVDLYANPFEKYV